MYSEHEAKERLLDYINDKRKGEPPFEVTSCRLSERGDYWILGANVIDPLPKNGGVYGYLVDNTTGKIIVCNANQGPEAYIQDQYDLQEAGERQYVLVSDLANTRPDILTLKRTLNINYRQALKLIRERKQWFTGKKRYLQITQRFLAKNNIPTIIELVKEPAALINVESEYWWQQEPIEALNKVID